MAALRLPFDEVEQLIRPTQQGVGRGGGVDLPVGRVGREQLPLAVLALQPLAQILHSNLQPPATSGAILDKVRGATHDGTSCRLMDCHNLSESHYPAHGDYVKQN
jgi:hypothetical protein